jgi:hypothetical protein
MDNDHAKHPAGQYFWQVAEIALTSAKSYTNPYARPGR